MDGSQFPTLSLTPKAQANQWEDVRDLCKAYGLVLDAWQENVLRASLGERADGRWAATRVGVAVPRQNGKTAIFEARELAGLLLFGEELLIHSAHLVATALEGFDRIKGYFENYDDLRRKVRRIREANGDQQVEMMTGQRLMFKARARGGIRGFSPDVLLLDEAQILPERAWSAMLPAMSARPNPQAWLAGTAPRDEDVLSRDAATFTLLREAAKVGSDRRLCWMEWGCEGPMPDVTDRKLWARVNPAYGHRIGSDAIADELHSSSPEMFAVERLNYWGNPDAALGGGVFDMAEWAKLANAAAKQPTQATLAIDVSPNQASASIGVAASGSDGKTLVMSQTQAGTAWVVPALRKMLAERDIAEVALFPGSQTAVLIPELASAGIDYTALTSRDVGQACGYFQKAVRERTIEHVAQPDLDAAVANATTRWSGEVEVWNRRERTIDISAVVAVSIAASRWGATAEPDYDPLDSIL